MADTTNRDLRTAIQSTLPMLRAPLPVAPGTRLGQFELIRELGRGGMGVVYLARDLKLGRRVAIKFLATESRALTDRFLEEARTTAALQHENIVVIHEVDEHDGIPHMVLEYLDGRPLRELMRERITPSRAVELLLPVTRAVCRAHEAGIVHRDLKPENIFVMDDGTIKVLDFGIALGMTDPGAPRRRVTADELDDSHSTILGTPQYMSPEQFGLDAIDHRSDIWAIGVMLFELLAGKHPLAPSTVYSLIAAVASLDEPMPQVGAVVHDVPEKLERIVDRCLAKHKTARYPDAGALLADLETLAPSRRRQLRDDESPYPGLTAFQEDDADRFFGRAREVARIATRIREQPFVCITGPSGIGKSSCVRAGIVPALKASGEAWESYNVRPGRRPVAALAAMLAADDDQLARRITAEPGYFGRWLRERAAQKKTRILVFVDQLEELFTLGAGDDQRQTFLAALASAADDHSSPLRLVASIRSDFVARLGGSDAFRDDLTRGLVFLQPLGRAELREALTRPLDLYGYRLESASLVDEMLDQLAVAPAALPLLQFAASRLWLARDTARKQLTRAAHDAMGGVGGALATHADQILASIPAPQHWLVRAIFERLVTPESTRAVIDLAELDELANGSDEARRIVDQLVAARLITLQTGEATTVELVHESLVTSWPTLRRWLDEDREDAALLAQLAASAKHWDERRRAPGLLWRGDALDEARRWQRRRPRHLAARERAFLVAASAAARRGRRLRLTALVGSLVVLAGIAVVLGAAYMRVSEAESVARTNAKRAETALAAQIAEATARQQAQDELASALGSLLSEEQLREAAEQGRLTAEQLAKILDLRRKAAEHKLAGSERERTQLQQQLQHATDAARLTREELLAKNKELDEALAAANRERARAEAARGEAATANAKLQSALGVANERIQMLEDNRRKIHTGELK